MLPLSSENGSRTLPFAVRTGLRRAPQPPRPPSPPPPYLPQNHNQDEEVSGAAGRFVVKESEKKYSRLAVQVETDAAGCAGARRGGRKRRKIGKGAPTHQPINDEIKKIKIKKPTYVTNGRKLYTRDNNAGRKARTIPEPGPLTQTAALQPWSRKRSEFATYVSFFSFLFY